MRRTSSGLGEGPGARGGKDSSGTVVYVTQRGPVAVRSGGAMMGGRRSVRRVGRPQTGAVSTPTLRSLANYIQTCQQITRSHSESRYRAASTTAMILNDVAMDAVRVR